MHGNLDKADSCQFNQSINLYLLKTSRDTHKRLFNCEQDNKAAAQLIN